MNMANRVQLTESQLNKLIKNSILEAIDEGELDEIMGWKKGDGFGQNLQNMANWAGNKYNDLRALKNNIGAAFRTGVGQSRMRHMDDNMGKRYAGDDAATALTLGKMPGSAYGQLRRNSVIGQNGSPNFDANSQPQNNNGTQGQETSPQLQPNPDLASQGQGTAQAATAQTAAAQGTQQGQGTAKTATAQGGQQKQTGSNRYYNLSQRMGNISNIRDVRSAYEACKAGGLVGIPMKGKNAGPNTIQRFKQADGSNRKFSPQQRQLIDTYNKYAANQVHEHIDNNIDKIIKESVRRALKNLK